jgi:heterodisulfide reductase subunit C
MSDANGPQVGWVGFPSPDFRFVDEVIKLRGEEKILDCIQCGTCSGTCPVRFAMDYSPMQIIRMAQLGMKETLFNANTIWICATCYSCTDRCPRGIDIGDTMRVLRNLSIQEGIIRPLFEAQGSVIVQTGRIWSASHEFVNEMRSYGGLTPITTIAPDDLKKLLHDTGIHDLLKKKEEKQ